MLEDEDAQNQRYANLKLLNQTGDNSPTARGLAKGIVRYFYRHHDLGFVLDACSGDLRMYRWFKDPRAECEVQRGKDCLKYAGLAPDTIMTNTPWGRTMFTPILKWAVVTARRHIILLLPQLRLQTPNRHAIFRDAGWRIRTQILLPPFSNLPDRTADDDPRRGKEVTRGGSMFVVNHYEKGWSGEIKQVDWTTSV